MGSTALAALEQRSDAQIRDALIAAARTLVAREGKLSLKRLYAESGIDRTGFLRCFSGKEALLAAIVSGDVKALGEIAEVAQPQAQQRVAQVGNLAVAAPPPPVDAWLERRLRVFERALAALETRQEKSERDLARNVSLLEEKLVASPAVPSASVAPVEQDLIFVPAAPQAAPEIQPSLVQAAAAKLPDMADMDLAFAETPKVQDTPSAPDANVPASEEEPISGREIDDFLAQARVAAQRASQHKSEPAHALSLPRWIGWMGVVAVTLLICAGLALGNVAGAAQNNAPASIAVRTEPQDALGRMMALADSGDARAQTALALAYLRGGTHNDDAAALRWGLAAARQGVPLAQYMVGTLYSKQDAARAFAWFQQAALRGNIKAMHNLAIAYAQGQGTAEDDRRAAAWFNRAAQQNYVDSQFDLAVLFERGQGVTQNRIAALKWYLIAARSGDGPSKARAEQLRAEMPDGESQRADQMAASWQPQPRDAAANAIESP